MKGKFEPKDREKLERITGLKYFSMEEYNRNHNSVYGADFCYQTLFSPQINFDGRLLECCMLWKECQRSELFIFIGDQDEFVGRNSKKRGVHRLRRLQKYLPGGSYFYERRSGRLLVSDGQ